MSGLCCRNRRSQPKSSKQSLTAVVSSESEQGALTSSQNEQLVQDKITLNVGGTTFFTFKDTLVRVPCTRLYYLMKTPVENLHPAEYDSSTGIYFFDRHPGLFEHILNYYRLTLQLHIFKQPQLHTPTGLDRVVRWCVSELANCTCHGISAGLCSTMNSATGA